MTWSLFSDQSIRSKLARAFVLTGGLSLVVAGVVFVVYDVVRFRESTVESLTSLVRVIAENSTAPLSFSDPDAARDTLEGLRAEPQIAYAAIFNRNGDLFAEFRDQSADATPQNITTIETSPWRDLEFQNGSTGYSFQSNAIDVYSDVRHLGDKLGIVVIRADLTELMARLYSNITVLLAVLLCAGSVAYYFSGRFQRQISAPIFALEAAMSEFSRSQAANTIVSRTTDDEIGRLVDGFNAMVEQIQARDRKLEEAMEALKIAKDSAELANEAKSRYIATLSHEIRGPMTGVVAMSDLLLEKGLSGTQHTYVGVIRRSAEGLLEFVNTVLDYAKIEAGRMSLESIDFSLLGTIASTVDTARATACPRGIELIQIIGPEIPDKVRGDPVRLKQVLVNLLGNAIKFTEEGSVTLRATKSDKPATSGDKTVICFEVIDTGIGISTEAQKTLFQPFRQADLSTTRRFGGSGLGLAITKELVDLMNGEIQVQSEVGTGAVFTFTVELGSVVPGEESASFFPMRSAYERSCSYSFEGKRVLLVEDSPLNQDVAVAVLRHFGCLVDTANDGLAAVEAVRSTAYDLILMDWHMPRMDGVTAAGHIQEIFLNRSQAAQPPIVLTTATNISVDGTDHARSVDDYLPKPYRVHQVAQLLNRWLRSSAVSTADGSRPRDSINDQDSTDGTVTQTINAGVRDGILDDSVLQGIHGLDRSGGNSLTKKIIDLFISHSRTLLDDLRGAWQSGDADAAFHAAHGLKSIASNVGGIALADCCDQVEKQLNEGRWDEARLTLRQLIEYHTITCARLSAREEGKNGYAAGATGL